MDVGDVTRMASALQQQHKDAAVQMAVVRKIREVEAQTAASLLAALPQPAATSNPPHLGQQVDTRA